MNVLNEIGQIVGCYVLPSESEENMLALADGLMKRQPQAPIAMYVDTGCCSRCQVCQGNPSEEAKAAYRAAAKSVFHGKLWDKWVVLGMLICLDCIHFLRRFEIGLTNPTNHLGNAEFWAAMSEAIFRSDPSDVAALLQVCSLYIITIQKKVFCFYYNV